MLGVVEPTTKGRVVTLDVLRGIAILGILLANIVAFAHPIMKALAPPPTTGVLFYLDSLRDVFVTGKFRGMLSILFGVGVYLQFHKRKLAWGDWPGPYIRRCSWLVALGLIHAIFIWYGDILFLYAVTAMLAALMVKIDDKMLLWIAGGILGFYILSSFGLAALLIALSGFAPQSAGSPTDMDFGIPMLSAAYEIRVFATGTYLDQLLHRSVMALFLLFQNAFMVPTVLALMLVGIYMARTGVLLHPSQHPQITRWFLVIGAIGLVLNTLPIALQGGGLGIDARFIVEIGMCYMLSIGYLIVGAILVEKLRNRAILKPIENVGRMALTTYLMQSLICTFVFYSWGLGWFGRMDAIQQLGVVGAVWLINILFAAVWLKFFAMGPVEWLWRSLSENRRIDMRGDNSEPLAPIPPPVMTSGPR